MQQCLVETLVSKGIIRENLEVEALYKTKGMATEGVVVSGTFLIKKVEKVEDGRVLFDLTNIKDGKNIRVSHRAIRAIDGMKPERYARVFNINPDGTIRQKGKKRGRKTKFVRMCIGLSQIGMKIDPSFTLTKELLDVVLTDIFPESANEDPSSIPNGTDVLETLEEWEVPTIKCDGSETGDDNFWSWDD